MKLAKKCKTCGLNFVITHFAKNRRSCLTCLQGVPPPEQALDADGNPVVLSTGEPVYGVVILGQPKEPRRWWPKFVKTKRKTKKRDNQ